MYYAAMMPHTDWNYTEVPEYYTNLYPNITDLYRKKVLGMMTLLDDSIGNLTSTLEAKGFIYIIKLIKII